MKLKSSTRAGGGLFYICFIKSNESVHMKQIACLGFGEGNPGISDNGSLIVFTTINLSRISLKNIHHKVSSDILKSACV